jgi:D-glycero-alpha-D-manno-heptose-7-phosphate kinase
MEENSGAVIATTIDKYCYMTCRTLPPFFDHNYRIVYSKIEHEKQINDIQHPSVRETIRFSQIKSGLEIHHDSDLPARTGLGSSSSFAVGLLNALNALQGKMIDKERLAYEAINIEQNMIKENVGCQDQVMAAHGGFNLVEFTSPKQISVKPIIVPSERLKELNSNLMLLFTGFARNASEIAEEQIKNTPKCSSELATMKGMVHEAISLLRSSSSITEWGTLLHESWKLKQSLSNKISTDSINQIYSAARSAGALGGKLLGAGGGGFMLLFAEPSVQPKIREALKNLLFVPFNFENSGSQIIFYRPSA